jgi:O-antigen/teichoic acid export membrane protein
MRAHLANAAYGVLDYAAYPAGMLLVAPVVLHHLGIAQFGIWTVATAAVNTGGIVASGFGDANIQRVASLRGSGDRPALGDAVRCMIGINLILGAVLALAGWLLAATAARHIEPSDLVQQQSCLISLRIASGLMLVRALETVCVSTQRAFERYGAAVRIGIGVRLLTLAVAAALAYTGRGTASIMGESAVLMVLGTGAQFIRLHQLLGDVILWPAFNREATRALFGFGIFSWLQAIAGVVFGQVDRLLLGVSLGAVAVASYALCVQLAQPVFGLTASGLHFLFPYLSGRVATVSSAEIRRTLLKAFACNLVLVAAGTALLLGFGDRILHAWAGEAIARAAAPIFPLIVIGSALLGLSVTGTYALLALGSARSVAWLSLAGGATMILTMVWLLPHSGVRGLAIARLCYGSCALLVYAPLLRRVSSGKQTAAGRGSIAPMLDLEGVSQL